MTAWSKVFWWAGLAAAGCSFLFRPSILAAQGSGGGYTNLTPSEARALIEQRSGDPRFVLLDVRTPKEFEEERIEGAVLIDFQAGDFRERVAGLDRERPAAAAVGHGYVLPVRNKDAGNATAVRGGSIVDPALGNFAGPAFGGNAFGRLQRQERRYRGKRRQRLPAGHRPIVHVRHHPFWDAL